jgi:DNA polymerase V
MSVELGTIEHMFEYLDGIRISGRVPAQTPPGGPRAVQSLVPAGWPSPAQDYAEADLDLNTHLIRNRSATFIVQVAGESMLGAGISDRDELIVDRSLTPVDGDVVIAVVEGELTVKRLRLLPGGPELHPENPDYPILRPRDLQIWGVVTTCLHRLRARIRP